MNHQDMQNDQRIARVPEVRNLPRVTGIITVWFKSIYASRQDLALRSTNSVVPVPPTQENKAQHLELRARAEQIVVRGQRQARKRRWLSTLFMLLVLLAAALYCFVFGAAMYSSNARFAIRGTAENGGVSVFGKMMNAGGGIQAAMTDGFAVRDYLISPDALNELERRLNFSARMKAPKGDIFFRLSENATREEFLSFYNKVVKARYNMAEGIISLSVYAYSPADAHAIASALREMAGKFSNTLNYKAVQDSLKVAREELRNAETRMKQASININNWRKKNDSLDVEANAKMVQKIIDKLEAGLAEARRELEQLRQGGLYRSPRRRTIEDRIRTLKAQILRENSRLTGSKTEMSVVNQLGDYQRLKLEEKFAEKSYELASRSLVNARTIAGAQQKFVALISAPTRPQTAVWPNPWKIIPLTLIASLMALMIGGLAYSVVRDSARS